MVMADHMAEDGFKDAGYEYVSIDVSSLLSGSFVACEQTLLGVGVA